MALQWRTMGKKPKLPSNVRDGAQEHSLLLTEQKANSSQLDEATSGRDKHTESETRKTANPKTHLAHSYHTGEGTIQVAAP